MRVSERGLGGRVRNGASSTDSSSGKRNHPVSIFTALDDFFRAYSVFKPADHNAYQLFEIVLIQSHPEARHRSPRRTQSNLITLVEALEEYQSVHLRPPYMQASWETQNCDQVCALFRRQFDRISSPYPSTSAEQSSPAFITASESSILRAGVSAPFSPSSNARESAGRKKPSSRQVKIADVRSHRYTGGILKSLIFNHIRILFPLILAENEVAFGSAVGDRRLLAIVTERIIARIGVCVTESIDSDLSSEYSGVSGLHMIMLPVERIGELKFRVFKPIDVCNAEHDDAGGSGASHGHRSEVTQSLGWHCGTENMNHGNAEVPTGTCAVPANVASASESPGTNPEFSTGPGRQSPVSSADISVCIDIPSHYDAAASIVIDLGEHLDWIPKIQLALANRYERYSALCGKGSPLESRVVALVRMALRKFRPKSSHVAVRKLADCYADGIGMMTDIMKAEELRQMLDVVGRYLRQEEACKNLQTLFESAGYYESKVPEVWLLEKMASYIEQEASMALDRRADSESSSGSVGDVLMSVMSGDKESRATSTIGHRTPPGNRRGPMSSDGREKCVSRLDLPRCHKRQSVSEGWLPGPLHPPALCIPANTYEAERPQNHSECSGSGTQNAARQQSARGKAALPVFTVRSGPQRKDQSILSPVPEQKE